MISLRCLDCGYSWKPRKEVTRYRRQCPKCDSCRFEKVDAEDTEPKDLPAVLINGTSAARSKWPKAVYNLMGISGASSPENALARAFELYRRALPYKFKHNLKSLEEVFEFLEKKNVVKSKNATNAKERLQSILEDPTLIFYETVGADLTTVNYYDALQKTGYRRSFLEFLNDIVNHFFESYGYESPEDFLAQN